MEKPSCANGKHTGSREGRCNNEAEPLLPGFPILSGRQHVDFKMEFSAIETSPHEGVQKDTGSSLLSLMLTQN